MSSESQLLLLLVLRWTVVVTATACCSLIGLCVFVLRRRKQNMNLKASFEREMLRTGKADPAFTVRLVQSGTPMDPGGAGHGSDQDDEISDRVHLSDIVDAPLFIQWLWWATGFSWKAHPVHSTLPVVVVRSCHMFFCAVIFSQSIALIACGIRSALVGTFAALGVAVFVGSAVLSWNSFNRVAVFVYCSIPQLDANDFHKLRRNMKLFTALFTVGCACAGASSFSEFLGLPLAGRLIAWFFVPVMWTLIYSVIFVGQTVCMYVSKSVQFVSASISNQLFSLWESPPVGTCSANSFGTVDHVQDSSHTASKGRADTQCASSLQLFYRLLRLTREISHDLGKILLVPVFFMAYAMIQTVAFLASGSPAADVVSVLIPSVVLMVCLLTVLWVGSQATAQLERFVTLCSAMVSRERLDRSYAVHGTGSPEDAKREWILISRRVGGRCCMEAELDASHAGRTSFSSGRTPRESHMPRELSDSERQVLKDFMAAVSHCRPCLLVFGIEIRKSLLVTVASAAGAYLAVVAQLVLARVSGAL